MYRRSLSLCLCLLPLALTGSALRAQTITAVGVDEQTNDAWRTTDVSKPFGDADNVYGTDGYFIAQYPNGDPTNVAQPAYGTIELIGGRGYEGAGAEAHQSAFDDVLLTGVGPVADLVAGDYWLESGPTGTLDDFFTITLTEPTSFRLGVITDQTPPNPPDLLWEAARGVGVRGPGGLDTGPIDALGPGEAWRNADVDYVLFDITGDAGDVFTIYGEQDARWSANALGGVFLDPLPNPNAPEISSFSATPNETDTPGTAIVFDWQVEVPFDSLVLLPGDLDLAPETDPAGAGSFTLDPGPDESTVYQLVASRGGETSSATLRVTIIPPEIVSFTADPNIIAPAAPVTVSWEVTPPITSLTLQPGDLDLLPDTDASGVGSRTLDPGPDQHTTYQLVAVRGASATSTAEAGVIVSAPGSGITIIGVDETTNDAWRSSDIEKPFGDVDNIYGTDGYFIAQFPNGDPQNLVEPPYASVQLVPGRLYEGLGAEAHQSAFDDVLSTGPGEVPDLVCGDYWLNSGPTGTEDDFFTITLTENATFRLGIICDQTPDNPPGLFWEASAAVRITGSNGADTGVVDVVGPNEEWRDADVDYALFDITGSAGDVFTVWGVNDSRWEANALGGVFFDPAGSPRGPRFSVERSDGDLLFKWDSQGGKLYNLLSVTDPSAPEPKDWPPFDGHFDIEATPPENTLTIPYPADAERFFVISEFNAPPVSIFSDDFEGGQGAWTTGSEGDLGTLWQLGTPANVGPLAAHSGTNCFGTNIDAAYTVNTAVWLRSPPIDLTTAGGATLSFFQFTDIELQFDRGKVSVLDASDDSELAVLQDDIEGLTPDWEMFTKTIPAAALGKTVKIEFRLFTDSFDGAAFAGWYLDDVEVTVP